MDPRLLRYYNQELQYIREMGGEFASQYPKIAGRLGMETLECADPYVERLLEDEGDEGVTLNIHLDLSRPPLESSTGRDRRPRAKRR